MGRKGRVVQVVPIKPTLKAPGIKLLKLEYGKPFSILVSNSTCAAATRFSRSSSPPPRDWLETPDVFCL